jgi:NAD-dependent deacetylase
METVPAEGGREAPPRCVGCGDAIRPGVVWFGETLPEAAWSAAVEAIADCELLVVVGISGLVHPAAARPAYARETGRRVLEINPTDTPIAEVAHASWREPASTGIARLERMLADGDLAL